MGQRQCSGQIAIYISVDKINDSTRVRIAAHRSQEEEGSTDRVGTVKPTSNGGDDNNNEQPVSFHPHSFSLYIYIEYSETKH